MSVVHLNDSTNDLAKLPRSAHSYVNNQGKKYTYGQSQTKLEYITSQAAQLGPCTNKRMTYKNRETN